MRRRPTAEDRELADIWRKLQPGIYHVTVKDLSSGMVFMELAELKIEGSTIIKLADKKISVVPTW